MKYFAHIIAHLVNYFLQQFVYILNYLGKMFNFIYLKNVGFIVITKSLFVM